MAFKDPNVQLISPIVDSLDSVDESLKGLYAETTDGKYQIRAELAFQSDFEKTHGALTKERDANKKLTQQIKELQGKLDAYDGVDATAVKGMQTELATLRSTESDLGKIKTSKADLELQFKNLKEQFEEMRKTNQRYETERAENRLKETARKALVQNGIEEVALEDGLMWATRLLETAEDGTVRVKKGDNTIFPEGIGVDGFAQILKKTKPYLFGGSVGGGASGSSISAVPSDNWTNTGLNGGINVTRLVQALKEDPKGTLALAKAKGLEQEIRTRFAFAIPKDVK